MEPWPPSSTNQSSNSLSTISTVTIGLMIKKQLSSGSSRTTWIILLFWSLIKVRIIRSIMRILVLGKCLERICINWRIKSKWNRIGLLRLWISQRIFTILSLIWQIINRFLRWQVMLNSFVRKKCYPCFICRLTC